MPRFGQTISDKGPEKRIVLINSYRMKEARRLVELGVYPAQHLWGLWNLSENWKTSVTNVCMNSWVEKSRFGRVWIRQIERFVGDPFQTLWALTGVNRGSLVYSANPKTGTLIGFLKRLRLLSVPYVVLVHSYPVSSWARWCLGAVDEILVFSDGIKRKMLEDGFLPERISVVQWGPDLSWKQYQVLSSSNRVDFTSAGKTNRDYATLRELGHAGIFDGHVLDGQTVCEYANGRLKKTVGRPSYPEVMTMMASSRVVVIPLEDAGMLSGLTEFCDALALGRPVVMTRNDWMPLDIQELGIGVWLDDHTPETITDAIRRASEIPDQTVLKIAKGFNMKQFSLTLEHVIDRAWRNSGVQSVRSN